ncbi:helix-turn-helix domain-containing protein [Paenibacillus sp. SC116]|uniref:helix-turn-helix domain-containing protein n=1 Tax=Paenibacillus sp. SC116 TaxID=2968986 RepID=UPI00215AAAC0|nr:helix-turn-helix transcriptional regulator [Paenibacillus sp. SC116]MCR8843556.1 helix-turn-helix domain-containing protein [Paenibacillus sp. SC116]
MEPAHSITALQYVALIHEISYTKVCKEIGITPQQFSDWVRKRRPIPRERLQSITKYFDIEPTLLIDEHHYLQDLTADLKIELQIMFLNKLLQQAEEGSDMDAYEEKLLRLRREKEQQHLINRFTAVIQQNDAQTTHLCVAFLDHIQSGNLPTLQQAINPSEE